MLPDAHNEHAIDTFEIARELDGRLPDIARTVIRAHLDPSDPATQAFLRRPDGREQHQTQWHQWGIITHTRVFLRHLDEDIPDLLRSWGLWSPVDGALSRRLDGARRWDLLRISILLHDIGKFASRTSGRSGFHFAHHERMSGEIIRAEIDLQPYGLTPRQIEYVATTAEDHFVLAVVRKQARERGGYDLPFIESRKFEEIACAIKHEHPDDFTEVGVLFLGDSLAKANPESGPERAVSQHAVNIAAARRYLELVSEGGAC